MSFLRALVDKLRGPDYRRRYAEGGKIKPRRDSGERWVKLSDGYYVPRRKGPEQ